jgi:hypothetical protein
VPAIWIWLLHKQESWKVDWLLYKQESWKVELAATQAGGVWKLELAATQAGKLEAETGCYTSRRCLGVWCLDIWSSYYSCL